MFHGIHGSRMTFRDFQQINARRCREKFHRPNEWPAELWALAIAGEAGELCNLLKKVKRGDFTLESKREDILREIADVITYCDLMVTVLEADTGTILTRKFDEVSARVGFADLISA